MGAEVDTIATGVQTLLDAIANANNVPQAVTDAATSLHTKLDALKGEAGA